MDAQQELFIALRNSIAQEYSVYDGYMPPEDTPYPFVYLADSQMIDMISDRSRYSGPDVQGQLY